MKLSDVAAYTLSRQLTTIDGCPRIEEALDALAADLTEICEDEEEARWITKEARFTWKKWAGTAGLIELLKAKRRPAAPLPRERQVIDLGKKPPIACKVCNDIGTVRTAGRHEWCDCEQGQIMRRESPGWLETLNRTILGKLPTPRPDRPPITEAELQQAFDEKRQQREAVEERMIAEARATLENPDASKDRKEIAREVLRGFGATIQ